MKKIKITEKQASLLGLNKLKENEEGGVKSIGVALGEVVIRMVVSGESVPKFKDRIIQLVMRHDKDAKIGFFEATGKIVGNIKEIKLDSIKRDIKALDPTITVEKKPIAKSLKEGVKNLVKITKEQYNRIFATKPLNETEQIKGGLNRVDTTFKKEFAGKKVQDMKATDLSEDKFDIKKPNPSMTKSSQGKFGKPVMENEGQDQFKNEVKELIKFLYRKSEEISPFWEKHGIKYDDICDSLLSKGLIISKNGKYEVAKTLGSPQAAIQAIEDQLTTLLPTQQGVEKPKADIEEDNYPAGAASDPNAPWNEKEADTTNPKTVENPQLEVVAMNGEIAILKDPEGVLYVFYYNHISKDDFMEYASVTRHYVGKDEDGQPEYEYDKDFDIDSDVISNYVNNNLSNLSKGEGLEAYENGIDLVKIDEPLKKELQNLYDKDHNLITILGPIEEEADYDKLMGQLKTNLDIAHTPKPATGETPEAKQSRIVAKLAELKVKEKQRQKEAGEIEEMTGAASAGAFTPALDTPVIKRELPEVEVIDEITAGVGSVGPYDANALPGINRDGSFKESKKTKAQTKTQWAGGGFVELSNCTKLNNGKGAENGKCSQGAVDNVVKVKKTHGNINAPSLGENEIYEAIAKETGKPIDEVKRIIDSKKKKA